MMKQKAELEANMLKQKADLEASIHLLQFQKVAAAAVAEASAYEEAEVQSGEFKNEPCIEAEPFNTSQRTSEYVHHQSELLFTGAFSHHTAVEPSDRKYNKLDIQDRTAAITLGNSPQINKSMKQEATMNTFPISTYHHNPPTQAPNSPNDSTPVPNGAQDFARYLIRKELVSTGLLQFDDKPENYWAWKASFISATKDLNLSAREELDLLTKWLGPKSSKQAKRIRAVHTYDPSAGTKMVWQRLEECYGSPEAIEDALLKKVEEFPKLTNKDNVKLRELSDILLELECAKQDGTLPGLTYLEPAQGVRQIVEKLPFNLQERWTVVGTQYKETHCVPFPPFSVFMQFVQQQAKMKNDPSFISSASSHVTLRTENPPPYNRKVTVSAHKTDIAANSPQFSPGSKKMEEPDRQCPIHKKPHPLKKCKLFRDKPIEERKAYLKEHHICYRCCGSVQHIAKDCKAMVKCIECDSTKHISALHPGPAFPPKSTTPESQFNDGEEPSENSPSVTSKCTEGRKKK
ncbi:uncharacterized protein LOC113143018 [Mastacembelus armatus]|uniref:uncharacterized protein LOC113143018 n=1 Tax=Mastacembelus armatus TaxID=205130 RepID=UPI000E453A03|nr:uncharacterized protein LOC113143018 [Mastacembelus armatus]